MANWPYGLGPQIGPAFCQHVVEIPNEVLDFFWTRKEQSRKQKRTKINHLFRMLNSSKKDHSISYAELKAKDKDAWFA